jgi:hypothetical protein
LEINGPALVLINEIEQLLHLAFGNKYTSSTQRLSHLWQ